MKFLIAIILALIAITMARVSNLAALQDIMNTLQESRSAQTLDADVEAFSKVSTQGLLEKLNEMKQKLNDGLRDAKNKFDASERRRVNKTNKANQDKNKANTDLNSAKTANENAKVANAKAKKAAYDEAEHNRGVVAQIKELKKQLSGMPFLVAGLDAKLKDLLDEIADKIKEADEAFTEAENARKAALAAAQSIFDDFMKEYNELIKEIADERKSDTDKYNAEKAQCQEELALIEKIIALVSPGYKLLGSISANAVNNHLITTFNDGGNAYTKIKLVNKGQSFTDWARGSKNAWLSKGFDIGKMAVKLDGVWYTAEGGPHKCNSHKFKHLPRSAYEIKTPNSVCWNRSKNLVNTCGDVVVINTGGKKFQGLSDIETVGGCWKGDNRFEQKYDVYGFN